MMTGRDFLNQLEAKYPNSITLRFDFPFTRISVQSPDFTELPSEEREIAFSEALKLTLADLRALLNRLFFRLDLLGSDEPVSETGQRGYFWMRSLVAPSAQPRESAPNARVLHFYGYKGGQARSIALTQLARVLANDGWKVLCVDMDAEAPSLDHLFNVRAIDVSNTILGIRASLVPTPVRAHTSRGDGFVDLIPFRPSSERFDLDAAALAMECAVFPSGLESLIERIDRLATNYDVLLVDHRTGLGASVPPWVNRLPGPVVIFARMDGQWRIAKAHFRALWLTNVMAPGIVVTFKPDDEPDNIFMTRTRDQRSELLEELAAVRATNGGSLEAEDIVDHWVLWPFDKGISRSATPGTATLDGPTQAALSEIRRLLEVSRHIPSHAPALNPSGAKDEGDLIQTRALRDLSTPNNPYTFVLGRKGTGKTRLLRELAAQGLGEPLLVAEDDKSNSGLPAGLAILRELEQTCSDHPEQYWWTIISAALQGSDTERESFQTRLRKLLTKPHDSLRLAQELAAKQTRKREFLIDGLETAFTRSRTFAFSGALFRIVSTTDNDPSLGEVVRMRVFARTDLAERGFENFEQQTFDRLFRLNWQTRDILNFALSRIRAISWFREQFGNVVAQIENRRQDVLEGRVSEEECDALLLQVFPSRLRKLNLNMTTFLRTYFSDDPTGRGSYYPRIYDEFLRVIGNVNKEERESFKDNELIDARISEVLITFAHEAATKSFLIQVKAELRNLIELDEDKLQRLLEGLKGTQTPFVFEQRIREVARRVRLRLDEVREAFLQMKTLGMFEDRPRYPAEWRVGRLFKSSLGMKYVRG